MRARKAKKQKIEYMTLREVKDKMKSGAKEIKKRTILFIAVTSPISQPNE